DKTIVFVTHDMDEAIKLADKIVIMRDGEIVQADTPEEIISNPANEFVEEFLGKDLLIQGRPDVATVGQVMETQPSGVEAGTTLQSTVSSVRENCVDCGRVVDGIDALQGYVNIHLSQQQYRNSSTVDEVIKTDVLAVSTGCFVRDTIRRI